VFIGATQADAWNELVKRYGGDADAAQARFADRLASELDRRGVVDVARHGAVDQGVSLLSPTSARRTASPLTWWRGTTPTG